MTETRKLAAIVVADVVGFTVGSPAAMRTGRLAQLRGAPQRPDRPRPSPPITAASSSAPATASIIEFRAWSTRCAARSRSRTRWSSAMRACRPTSHRVPHRHPPGRRRRGERRRSHGRRRQYRRAARGRRRAGRDLLSEDAYRQVKARLDLAVSDLGPTQLKNIAEPVRVYSLAGRCAREAKRPSRRRGRVASGWRVGQRSPRRLRGSCFLRLAPSPGVPATRPGRFHGGFG